MLTRLPFTLPSAHVSTASAETTALDVDTGGYDVMIGGHGFRLATDQQFSYQRMTEPTTVRRFDNSMEPGEQSLSPLPWIKSQSSFHGGAGQLNLEQGLTAFQYQQEQVEQIRYDTSIGIDCWTPGVVKRLPDTKFTALASTASVMITASKGGVDYAVIGGAGKLVQVAWTTGPDNTPTITNIDLTGGVFGGAANCTVKSLTTDGVNYYALIQLTAAGSDPTIRSYVVSGSVDSAAAPTLRYKDTTLLAGLIGWSKARLIGALGASVYELSTTAANVVLPTAKYTHPSAGATYTAVSESPGGVLVAAIVGMQSTILELSLDTSGNTPTLGGGTTVGTMPPGETIYSLDFYLGSFLGIGSSLGLRIATFDTYTGGLKQGPLSVVTTQPVISLTGRDRFIYAGFTNQQADGKTGLVRLDLSMIVDASGRMAYAPDLRPPTTATTGLGSVVGVSLLPKANRVVFVTPEGVHVEGAGPGTDGDAWLRTSRIRYDTTELKLFTLGRIHGTLDVATISILGITPFQSDVNLGSYGFVTGGDPGEFGLVDGLHEWLQLKFTLAGAACELRSYQVKALPAPQRQHLITFTVNCFRNETDRFGLDVTDPEQPRTRYENVRDLEALGDEVRFVEFTNSGAVAEVVVIDQLAFQSFSRPNIEDDFGGYITFKLRTTGG